MDEESANAVLNSLFSKKTTPNGQSNVGRKRHLPNSEVEETHAKKHLIVVTPVFNRPQPSDMPPYIDTSVLMGDLNSFMKEHGVTQSQLSRKLNIQQMWISRMLTSPKSWGSLQENGRDHCHVINTWMSLSVDDRLNSIQEERRCLDDEFAFTDAVNIYEMVRQMENEMKAYHLKVSDYAKGSGVKYSWVYKIFKTPNVYDGFNSSGKRQARIMYKYLQIPIEIRASDKFQDHLNDFVDTAEVAEKVVLRLKTANIPLEHLCHILDINQEHITGYLRQPPRWSKLVGTGKEMFAKLADWIETAGDNSALSVVKQEELDGTEDNKQECMGQMASSHGQLKDDGPPEMNTVAVSKAVKGQLKLLKISIQKLGAHLGIDRLAELMQYPGRWEKWDKDTQHCFRLMKAWLESPEEEKFALAGVPEFQAFKGASSVNLGGGLAAEFLMDDGSSSRQSFIMAKEETEDSTTTDEPSSTPHPFCIKVHLPEEEQMIRCSSVLIRAKCEFAVKKNCICLNVGSTETSSLLKVLTEHGFSSVTICSSA